MNLRSVFKSIIPPVIVDVLRELLDKKTKEYQDFESALADSSPSGYQFERLILVVFEKAKRYVDSLNSQKSFIADSTTTNLILAAFYSTNNSELVVIDFGGGCGVSYHQVRKVLSSRIKIDWRVVETLNMVKAAKSLSNSELSFFSSLKDATEGLERVDLFYSSGTLQYLPYPLSGLQEWLAVGATHLYLTRLSLTSENEKVVIVQESWFHENGIGPLPEGIVDELVKYPHTILPKAVLLNEIEKKYELSLILVEKPGIPKANKHSLEGLAFLATKLNQQ